MQCAEVDHWAKKNLLHIGRHWPTLLKTRDLQDTDLEAHNCKAPQIIKGSPAYSIEEVLYAVSKKTAEVVSSNGNPINILDLMRMLTLPNQFLPPYRLFLSLFHSTYLAYQSEFRKIESVLNPPLTESDGNTRPAQDILSDTVDQTIPTPPLYPSSPLRSDFELTSLFGGLETYEIYSSLRSTGYVVHRFQRFHSFFWFL